jgi:hypothetical protein
MAPLRVTLRRVLSVLGLDYYISEGVIVVSDEESVQRLRTAGDKSK